MKNKFIYGALIAMAFAVLVPSTLVAQTEVMAWGNMTGVRVDGELMEFESSLRLVKDWDNIVSTGKEKQSRPSPNFHRDGKSQIVKTTMERIRFEQTVTDTARGSVDVSVDVFPDTTWQIKGLYFAMTLPERYAAGTIRTGSSTVSLASLTAANNSNPRKSSGRQVTIEARGRKLQLNFASGVSTFVRKEDDGAATLYVRLAENSVRKGQKISQKFTMLASGDIDTNPVTVNVDATRPGRQFDGLGGNFRLQNPRVDPQVITYCLENLRVSWGRVEMPWRFWQPEENVDPLAAARAGEIPAQVDNAMKMAQRLGAIGMPVIVSAWFPPVWATVPRTREQRVGTRGEWLAPEKQAQIYKSIADYLVLLKEKYGVEAWAFSFNESDLGINVFHTPQEHSDFIKGFGSYMASRGLATKMLLGDNSDATTFDFIVPAMNDPETHPYIAAVSFHSWRGCDDETLRRWGGAAKTLNVPLLIGEGSTDAAAHQYNEIFLESTFAFYEINLYTRICAIAQPLSILQWQLTSDYSIVWGDGVYGSTGPIRPTQRFWNLKQLASTPEQSFALPFTCDKTEVNCAAFGNIARGEYSLHMVNNGASRPATIKGLPADISEMKICVTNETQGMQEMRDVRIENGEIRFQLPAMSFVTLMGK